MTANDTDTDDWEPTDEGDEPPDDDDGANGDQSSDDSAHDDRAADDRATDDASARNDGSAIGTHRSITEYVQWALLGILLLVAIIATLRFYFAASTAVDRFVSRQYRPLFQAAFNLVVLLAAGLGLSVLVRRLS